MSGLYLPSEYAIFAGQPYFQEDIEDYFTAWAHVIAGYTVGRLMAWLGVWPGDPRNRWIWAHGNTAGTYFTLDVYYWDWALGDHQHIKFADFQVGYKGQDLLGANTGVFTPYL